MIFFWSSSGSLITFFVNTYSSYESYSLPRITKLLGSRAHVEQGGDFCNHYFIKLTLCAGSRQKLAMWLPGKRKKTSSVCSTDVAAVEGGTEGGTVLGDYGGSAEGEVHPGGTVVWNQVIGGKFGGYGKRSIDRERLRLEQRQ